MNHECPTLPPMEKKMKSVTWPKETQTGVWVLPQSRPLHHQAVAVGTCTCRSCQETGASTYIFYRTGSVGPEVARGSTSGLEIPRG